MCVMVLDESVGMQPHPREVRLDFLLSSLGGVMADTTFHRHECKTLLPATYLKTEILVEKRHHMVLEAIRINFEAVRDSILVENVVQFAGIDP
jgi:hypothetical protein